MSFLGEVKRRKVFQVAAVYAVVAWLLVQIVVSVEEPLSLPTWADTLVIILLVVGFPVAVILGWALESPGRAKEATEARAEARPDATPAPVTEPDVLPNSVAVLPFENLSLDQKDAFFAVGIHEAILNQLVRLSDLHVMARTSVLRYADGKTPISQIASELRVQTVMEGSVQYADDRVRITAQLIDGKTGAHLWSDMYDRESADIFAVQTDIATRIANAMQAKLTPKERAALGRSPTASPEAYALYLKAISLSTLSGGIEAAPEESANFLGLLDEALGLDPDFAIAYALKAREYAYSMSRPMLLSDELDFARRDELALQNAEHALTLDPSLGVAYAGLGAAHRFTRRDAEATVALERALELNPYHPRVLRDIAFFHLYRGRYERSLEIATRSIDIEPTIGYSITALSQWSQGDLDAATGSFGRALSLAPNLTFMHLFLGWVLASRGRRDDALQSLQLAERLGVAKAGGAMMLAYLAMAYHELGHLIDAQRVVGEIESLAQDYVVTDTAWALAYLAIDDADRALEFLHSAVRNPIIGEDLTEAMIAFNMAGMAQLELPEFVDARKGLAVARA